MNMEMFVFIVVFILRIYSVRTDDDYDTETTEMDTLDYVSPTTTTLMENDEKIVSYTHLGEEKKIRHQPNFDPDVYTVDVWNQKPYQPYTPPDIPNIEFASWKGLKVRVKASTYGGRKFDTKLFFIIVGVVLGFYVALKLFIYCCNSKNLQKDVSEHIIIPSGSGLSQSDTVPSDQSSATNRFVLLNFPGGLASSNTASRSQQTEPAVQKSDSKRIVISIPLHSRKDETEHPQPSYANDLRSDACRGAPYPYPVPPPPYQ